MSLQKDAGLRDFVDDQAPPTIVSTKLTPELSEAALNLTIDFQRQKQSGANAAIIRHPIIVSTLVVVIGAVGYWKLGEIIQRGGFKLLKLNIDQVMGTLVIATMIISVLATLVTRPTDVLRSKADSIVDNSESVFGFELREFAALNVKKLDKTGRELLDTAENTRVVIYRDTPIAVVSLVPVTDMCTKERFVTKITGVGVRKVYWRSGIIEDLIDWTVFRSGQLNNSKAPKILVLYEVVNTDHELIKVLKAKQFQKIESRPVSGNSLLKLLGIQYDIYGLGLNVTKLSDVENLKTKAGASGSKRKA